MNVLEVNNLCKTFSNTKVVDDVSFSIPEHSIFGFIGKNGAGKTTTIKMILGLLKPDSGNINILSEKVSYGNSNTNRYVGYLPDVPEFYNYMKPTEYLKLCGEISRMSSKDIKLKSDELLELVGLKNVNKRIGGFSRGMKQRLGCACALLNEPRLLICDEPTSALDPVGRKEILDLLSAVKEKTTVLFSTHILSDVERICDKVAVLDHGKLVLSGDIENLKDKKGAKKFLIEFDSLNSQNRFLEISSIKPLIKRPSKEKNCIIFNSNNTQDIEKILLEAMVSSCIYPYKFERYESSLEELFLEVVR